MFNKIIKTNICLIVFLLPLFFLPFSFEAFEFNKQYLLFFLVSFSLFAWLGKMIVSDNEIRFRKTPFDIFIIVFVFIAILSSIFSVDKNSSFFGFYGRFSDGLILLLSLVVLYFLITNNVKLDTDKSADKNSLKVGTLIKILLWSVFFVILFAYFSVFGLWQKIDGALKGINLPSVMLQDVFNPVSGSLEGLSVFLAVIIVLLTCLFLTSDDKKKQFGKWVLWISSLILLVLIDFTPSWIVLITTFSLFLIFSLWRRIFKENVNRLLLPIFLIVISSTGVLINIGGNIPPNLPQEQVLSQGISWQIAFKSAIQNVKSGFLGSGMGTFSYEFSKFKPADFNKTRFWQIRFDRPGSYIAEVLGTTGFLGIISYLLLIVLYLTMSWFICLTANVKRYLPFLATFLALFIAQTVYYQSTVLAFLFWVILAFSVANWQPQGKSFWAGEKVFSMKDFPELNLVFTTFLIIIGICIAGSYFFAQKFYRADAVFLKAQGLVSGSGRTSLIEKAVNLNPWNAQYQIILARTYLNEVSNELGKSQEEQNPAVFQAGMSKAIDVAKYSTSKSPNQVAAWETQAMVYRDIRSAVAGSGEWAVKSFEEALKLEPANPVFFTELGKLYLASEDIEKARDSFAKAIELKSDYIDALIQTALIYENEDNPDEAIKTLEDLVWKYPLNIDVRFQLGRLYFNENKVNDAITQFETIITLTPNHSNALYSLGIAYTKKGQTQKAISAFEKVLELNPDNQDVVKKLNQLRK